MAGWHFASVPKKQSEEIKKNETVKRGWGSIPVQVTVGKTSWKTSIFPDKRSGSYLLPIKAEVRRKEHIFSKEIRNFKIEIVR